MFGTPMSELRGVIFHITATRYKWKRPHLKPNQVGALLTYPGGLEGWVDIAGYIQVVTGPGVDQLNQRIM